MLSQTNNYIAAIHAFEYERLKGTFLQNHFSETALPISTSGLDKGCISQDRLLLGVREEKMLKILKHMAMETMFGDFYIAERNY